MTERRSTSVRQVELLINFMERHKELALGRLSSKQARVQSSRLWEECADIVNSEGVRRTPKEWAKFWNDYKCRVRSKLMAINRDLEGTGGGPSSAPELSLLEDRVASIIGKDIGPITGVRRDAVIENVEVLEEVVVNVTGESNVPEQDSLSLLSNIEVLESRSPAARSTLPLSPERTMSLDTIPDEGIIESNPFPQPAHNNQRIRHRRTTRPYGRSRLHHSNNTVYNEAQSTIARIEEMRARTEEMIAAATLKQAEASLKHAEAMNSIAESLKIIAERYSRT